MPKLRNSAPSGRDSMPERLPRFNPVFLDACGIVRIERRGEGLEIVSSRPLTQASLNALQFATELPIAVRVTSSREWASPVDLPAAAPAGETRPLAGESLAARATAAMRRQMGEAPAATLARFLDAGFSAKEAGQIMLAAAPDRFAELLAQGSTLAQATAGDARFPQWMHSALAAFPAEAEAERALPMLAACQQAMAQRRRRLAPLALETAAIWAIVAIVWFAVSVWAGALVALAGTGAMALLLRLQGASSDNALMRADVLTVTGVLSAAKLPPGCAIRAAMAHLGARSPTWGVLPDTREGLADALRLDPSARMLLLQGDLAAAAERVAHGCALASEKAVDLLRLLSRAAAAVLLGAALIVLLW